MTSRDARLTPTQRTMCRLWLALIDGRSRPAEIITTTRLGRIQVTKRKEVSKMKKLHRGFLGSAVLMLGLTGAVRGSQGAATASEACRLITRQEAATAFGAPVPLEPQNPWTFP